MPPALERAIPQKPHPFDLLHGTDTGGYSSGGDFSATTLSAIYTTAYFGTTPSACKQALSALPVEFEDYTFVDIGCGKGRALLVAVQFPFRHLLGVELSSDLCTIARANIATDPRNIERVSIVNQDAIKLAYPDGPLVLFLFDPFVAPVLRRVLANLERQLRRSPRPAYLLYEWHPHTPGITKVINSFKFLKEISDTPYTFSPEDAAFDPFERTEENFTLYSINGTH
jgi:SAM-dependent methyltransferase